ncbi:hypothetical protein [Halorussus pelagicus]|uniref:hypothetical protein n=1 Tax=Halorussus pelagicus TaxID=2505977 RepID=UPI000FFB6F39|nr:hypothetical protein [Halorussus pelagicus]
MLKSNALELNADDGRNRTKDRTAGEIAEVDEPCTSCSADWRGSVDTSSTSVRRVAGLGPVLAVGENFDLSAWVPTIPWWFTWVVLPLLLLAGLWWAIRERSVSGAADRGERNVRRAVTGAGFVGAGVLGAFLGTLEGLESVGVMLGDVLISHHEILAKVGAVGGSWAVLDRVTALGPSEILLVLGVLSLVILSVNDK